MAATRFSIPGFSGELIHPDDAAYDEARAVFNGMIDRRPEMIARCTGVADVMAAVSFAREHDLPLAVRGGGHSVPGYAVCDAGVEALHSGDRVEIELGDRPAFYS